MELEEIKQFMEISIVWLEISRLILGLPLHHDNLSRDVKPLVETIQKKMTGWRGIFSSSAAKRILIQTCLSCIPILLLSLLKSPKVCPRYIDLAIPLPLIKACLLVTKISSVELTNISHADHPMLS
jgi:hypothetical protein